MNDRHGISELTLENFKAFSEKRQHMPIKPLTLVYGPNSSGKSSLLQAIALAHEAVVNGTGTIDTHRTRLAGDSIDLGGFQQYVHRREATRNVNLGFRLDVENYGKIFIDFTIGTLPDTEYQGVNRPVYTKQFSVRHRGKVILSLNFNQSGAGMLMEYDKNHHLFVRGHSHYYRVFRKSLQQGPWRNKQKRPRSGVFGAKTFGKLCIMQESLRENSFRTSTQCILKRRGYICPIPVRNL